MSALDGQIPAIAKSHDFSMATRNVKDFVDCNVDLINPFSGN
jgi:predicted nucleic acid-binding protein